MYPNTLALEEIKKIFVGMGYEVVEGPEVEYDHYNFEALNIPDNHPAKILSNSSRANVLGCLCPILFFLAGRVTSITSAFNLASLALA